MFTACYHAIHTHTQTVESSVNASGDIRLRQRIGARRAVRIMATISTMWSAAVIVNLSILAYLLH